MTDINEQSLWNQFNLGENNPDQAGGVLYAIRYDTDSLEAHRSSVVEAVDGLGVKITELDGERLGIEAPGLSSPDEQRLFTLLEELSVINEAIEYHEAGMQPDSIEQFCGDMRASFLRLFFDDELVAFDMVNAFIPGIIRSVEAANTQNHFLTSKERGLLKDLGEYARKRADLVARGELVFIS